MDIDTLFNSVQETLGATLPGVLGALAILIIGWVVAIGVRAVVRRSVGFLRVNERLRTSTGNQWNVEEGLAVGAYYLILLLVLVAFFNALRLDLASGSLQSLVDQVFAYAPKLIAGAILLVTAWIVASLLRTLATKALEKTKLDEKLSREAGMQPISTSLGNVLFWLAFLLFLPAVFGALELEGLLGPVQNMANEMVGMLPNILAAAAVGVAGWFLARILRNLVTNLLEAAGADRLGERAGLKGTMTLSALVGLVVYVLVLVPALVAALDALQIESIATPATAMLDALLAAIPSIFGAALVLAVAWFLAGFVSHVLGAVLGGLGFDALPGRLGLEATFSDENTPSKFVGKVAFFFIMLFAVVEAASQLGFTQAADLVAGFIVFGGQVLLGMAIITAGFWLSGLAREGSLRAGASPFVAGIGRFAILGIVVAMGLRAMGLADDIVNLAFGLSLGAVALGAGLGMALAFGLGGREAAGKRMDEWLGHLGTKDKPDTP